MNILHDRATMLAALDLPLPEALRPVLAERVRQTVESGLADLTTIVVARATDPEESVADEIGGSLLVNPLDGKRWGEDSFAPDVDWIEAHDGWWELIRCVGDGGFAYILFVEERRDDLGEMCRALAQR